MLAFLASLIVKRFPVAEMAGIRLHDALSTLMRILCDEIRDIYSSYHLARWRFRY